MGIREEVFEAKPMLDHWTPHCGPKKSPSKLGGTLGVDPPPAILHCLPGAPEAFDFRCLLRPTCLLPVVFLAGGGFSGSPEFLGLFPY